MIRIAIFLIVVHSVAAADQQRARPPEFTDEDRAAFFDDGFATLVGERPTLVAAAAVVEPRDEPSTGAFAWSTLVATDVLETEIKRQASTLSKAVRSTSTFKAGKFREASDAVAMLATLFAVTAEHGERPRWEDVAASVRQSLASVADAVDEASDAAFEQASNRAYALQDLVRGGRPDLPEASHAVDWAELASRSALMRRMATAEEEQLRGWVASERAFRRSAEDIRHEAQVLAILAEAAIRPEADDHDDPDYQAHARQLRKAAVDLAAAAGAEDQPAAARAMTAVSRSCVDCHADYRG